MIKPLNPNIAATFPPPVMEARRWIAGVTFPADRPLINVSQAAPVLPPPEGLRQALADAVLNEAASHLYGPVLGMPELRAEVAGQWSRAYGGTVLPEQVAITSGCNQAFTATLTTLAGAGDEVLLPVPWYFNHKMHLDMAGVVAVPLATDGALLPDIDVAKALITPKTKAIVLVSPNNPGGVEYPAELVLTFFKLAQAHGIALVLDETYRDFDSRSGAPHKLFQEPAIERICRSTASPSIEKSAPGAPNRYLASIINSGGSSRLSMPSGSASSKSMRWGRKSSTNTDLLDSASASGSE